VGICHFRFWHKADMPTGSIDVRTFFTSQAVLFVVLAAHHSIPTVYPFRSYVDAGGLMSYGSSLLDAYRQMVSTLAAY
jgi:hypothetical protein